ncbi:MAG: hypothetical protein ACHQSE_15360 [Gemmatimonadales bacterium]
MNRLVLTVSTGALAIALAACGDNSTSPQASNLDVTATDSALVAVNTAANETMADVNTLNGVSSTMGWSVAAPNSGVSMNLVASQRPELSANLKNDCTYNPADGRFHCLVQVNGNGVSVIRSLAFFDTTGAMMDHFDSTTASMNVLATLSGIVVRTNGADTVNATRNLTATGLFGHNTTRIWNGTGDGTHGAYWTDNTASRTSDVSFTTTFSNVVVDLPRSSNPYPVSGTITRVVTGTGTVIKGNKKRTITISRTVTVTFNGTETVKMVTGSQTFTVDLATGVATQN